VPLPFTKHFCDLLALLRRRSWVQGEILADKYWKSINLHCASLEFPSTALGRWRSNQPAFCQASC